MLGSWPWIVFGGVGLCLVWGIQSKSDLPGRIGILGFFVACLGLGGTELPGALRGDGFLWSGLQITLLLGVLFLSLLLLWRALEDGSLGVGIAGLALAALSFLPFALDARSPKASDLRLDLSRLLPAIEKECLPSGEKAAASPLLESCLHLARQRWLLQRRLAKELYPTLRDLEAEERKRFEALDAKLRFPSMAPLQGDLLKHPLYPEIRRLARLLLYRERLQGSLQRLAQSQEEASFLLWDLAQQIRLRRSLQPSTLREIQVVGEKLLEAQKFDPLGEISAQEEASALRRLRPRLPSPLGLPGSRNATPSKGAGTKVVSPPQPPTR